MLFLRKRPAIQVNDGGAYSSAGAEPNPCWLGTHMNTSIPTGGDIGVTDPNF
jgi:hypothetical protein